MIAGTLVVFGRVGPKPGRASKRGSIVAAGGPCRRYCGDAGNPGKGEILEWVAD